MNELTVEEMARELADYDFACPYYTPHGNCEQYNNPTPERKWAGCEDCWMANATEAEIRAMYAEMKGERHE